MDTTICKLSGIGSRLPTVGGGRLDHLRKMLADVDVESVLRGLSVSKVMRYQQVRAHPETAEHGHPPTFELSMLRMAMEILSKPAHKKFTRMKLSELIQEAVRLYQDSQQNLNGDAMAGRRRKCRQGLLLEIRAKLFFNSYFSARRAKWTPDASVRFGMAYQALLDAKPVGIGSTVGRGKYQQMKTRNSHAVRSEFDRVRAEYSQLNISEAREIVAKNLDISVGQVARATRSKRRGRPRTKSS